MTKAGRAREPNRGNDDIGVERNCESIIDDDTEVLAKKVKNKRRKEALAKCYLGGPGIGESYTAELQSHSAEKYIMSELKKYLRTDVYDTTKFVDDMIAKCLWADAVKIGKVVLPEKMEYGFMYVSAVVKQMGELRHNSQTLARNKYMGEWWIRGKVMKATIAHLKKNFVFFFY